MHLDTAKEIIACLPSDRTLFHYYPQRYALVLLSHLIGERTPVNALRKRAYRKLLEQPAVKAAMAMRGDGHVDPDTFRAYWPAARPRGFVLTLSTWGERGRHAWYQTSRGGHNLVLQLNINAGDMACLRRFTEDPTWFNCWGHPSRRPDQPHYRETLAWARLDLDFHTNEALIEEVQSDFVRDLQWYVSKREAPAPALVTLLQELRGLWQEAILTATIEFVWRELGIDHVYYHEFETGNRLKALRYGKPPRSLYERLPRRFCMTLTNEAPQMLRKHRQCARRLRGLSEPKFFQLSRAAA
ncbi:MAG: hypothetical protein AAGA68_07715 [Pseudomonadota bacterium]